MIITLDGPAGTGKSSVAQSVARRLGYAFLDTGAMYRAVALAAIRAGVSLADQAALGKVARDIHLNFDFSQWPPMILLDGRGVDQLIRSEACSSGASKVAVSEPVRHVLVDQQRRIASEQGNLVTEGRDQGSVVFPNAELKVYLDASPEIRARRRTQQLHARHELADEAIILQQILQRDQRDKARAVGPLVIPPGACVIDTSNMTQDQVIEEIVRRAQEVVQ